MGVSPACATGCTRENNYTLCSQCYEPGEFSSSSFFNCEGDIDAGCTTSATECEKNSCLIQDTTDAKTTINVSDTCIYGQPQTILGNITININGTITYNSMWNMTDDPNHIDDRPRKISIESPENGGTITQVFNQGSKMYWRRI